MRKVAILGADIFEDQRELTLFNTTDIEATYYSCKDPLDLVDKLADIDGLIVNLEKVTPELLSHFEKLKVVGRYGVGVDNIDLKAATEKKVAVINVPDYCVDEVAEHAVSFIFAVNRKLFTSASLTKQGVWGKVKDLKPIYPIKDITLGVVGTGRIGMKVIQTMVPFGTKIVVFDPYIKQENLPDGVMLVSFDELLEISDIITIHCPLTEQTRHLFNTASFGKMHRKPALINVSRGPIIDEVDLLAALDNGTVSFAALDVMEVEPPATDAPLLHHPKAIVTNHIAWYSIQAEVKLRDLLVTRVIDYLDGKPVPSIVNKF
ncbi:C-terminal binding protein [Paenibacillus psychroresistens]|uniref:C-terminal binding protein n=1 Tax=Paenibacillus psychroresistens TaxID=1778678 RepID=A0A6B8RFT5_9BACL|nr:C-terminal binding protein [Paenibacillus psychroresistens]QGQ94288.1 C-terminal binding protein [Paenibacillus psychroresistens]